MAIVGTPIYLGSHLVQTLLNSEEVFTNTFTKTTFNPVTGGLVLELNPTADSYPGSGDTWFDVSGKGYNFKQSGSAAWGGASVGWNLNGSTQYLWNTSSLPTEFTGPISSSLTIFVQADPKVVNSGDRVLYGNWMATPTKILFEINPGSTMEVAVKNTSGITGGNTTGTVTTGMAVFTMTVSGSNLIAFRNNSQLTGTVATSGTWTSDNPQTYIGAREFPAATLYGPFSGSIKSVLAYNRALSSDERTQVYNYLLTL